MTLHQFQRRRFKPEHPKVLFYQPAAHTLQIAGGSSSSGNCKAETARTASWTTHALAGNQRATVTMKQQATDYAHSQTSCAELACPAANSETLAAVYYAVCSQDALLECTTLLLESCSTYVLKSTV
jgi:hypothetical protein